MRGSACVHAWERVVGWKVREPEPALASRPLAWRGSGSGAARSWASTSGGQACMSASRSGIPGGSAADGSSCGKRRGGEGGRRAPAFPSAQAPATCPPAFHPPTSCSASTCWMQASSRTGCVAGSASTPSGSAAAPRAPPPPPASRAWRRSCSVSRAGSDWRGAGSSSTVRPRGSGAPSGRGGLISGSGAPSAGTRSGRKGRSVTSSA